MQLPRLHPSLPPLALAVLFTALASAEVLIDDLAIGRSSKMPALPRSGIDDALGVQIKTHNEAEGGLDQGLDQQDDLDLPNINLKPRFISYDSHRFYPRSHAAVRHLLLSIDESSSWMID
jgi:hypothetical protein